MTTIRTMMTEDHHRCDDLFAAVENAIARHDLERARQSFSSFVDATLTHFAGEEDILFPAFEARTGLISGPTEMMRREHTQLRALMQAAQDALAAGNTLAYLAEADTLLIMLQQHNMKEENILYPMCDHRLVLEVGEVCERLFNQLHDHKELA